MPTTKKINKDDLCIIKHPDGGETRVDRQVFERTHVEGGTTLRDYMILTTDRPDNKGLLISHPQIRQSILNDTCHEIGKIRPEPPHANNLKYYEHVTEQTNSKDELRKLELNSVPVDSEQPRGKQMIRVGGHAVIDRATLHGESQIPEEATRRYAREDMNTNTAGFSSDTGQKIRSEYLDGNGPGGNTPGGNGPGERRERGDGPGTAGNTPGGNASGGNTPAPPPPPSQKRTDASAPESGQNLRTEHLEGNKPGTSTAERPKERHTDANAPQSGQKLRSEHLEQTRKLEPQEQEPER